jgi:DNA polymerase III sliding clamp (beta) subunit (PCNA family)
MKITVLQENLKQQLDYLQKVIPSKPQLPILSSILLRIEKKQIASSSHDLYLGIRASLVVEVKERDHWSLTGILFVDLIASLSPGKIDLELSEAVLKITQGKNKKSN